MAEKLEKIVEKFHKIYGDDAPDCFIGRLYEEGARYLENDDAILFEELLGKVRASLRKMGYYSYPSMTYGSTLISYLLGVSDENPLPLHYYCTKCKRVELINKNLTPWDIESKECECGGKMVADGFNIPYETHSRMIDAPMTALFVGIEALELTYATIKEVFKDFNVVMEEDEHSKNTVFSILPRGIYASGDKLYESFPSITIIAKSYLDDLKAYESKHGIKYEDIDFSEIEATTDVLDYGALVDDKITDIKPQNKYELLKICGLLHGTNIWVDNGDRLIANGDLTLSEIPAYREDIYDIIKPKIEELGYDKKYADIITRLVRMGKFALYNIPKDIEEIMDRLTLPWWFDMLISSIKYMFAKAHGIKICKISLALSYYKSLKK